MVRKKSGAKYKRGYVARIKSDPQQHEEHKKRRAAQDREGRKRRMHLMRNWSSEERTRESKNDFVTERPVESSNFYTDQKAW